MQGGGRVVDIRSVQVHRISAYLSKYLTKDLLLSVPAKKKRISTSRDISLFDKREPSGWQFARLPNEYFWDWIPYGTPLEAINVDEVGIRFFAILEDLRDGPY